MMMSPYTVIILIYYRGAASRVAPRAKMRSCVATVRNSAAHAALMLGAEARGLRSAAAGMQMALVAVLAVVGSSQEQPRGAPVQSIWLIGESLMSIDAGQTAAIVLSGPAARRGPLRYLVPFAVGPGACSAWFTDSAHDQEQLPLRIKSIEFEDEYEEEAVLRSSHFTTDGPFTVEVKCQYGLLRSAAVDGETGLAVAPPLLTYYSSAQGGAASYADYHAQEAQRSNALAVSVYHHGAVVADGGQVDHVVLATLSHISRPSGLDQCSLDLPNESGADARVAGERRLQRVVRHAP
eukprot:SAG31_NODE_9535_length_1262_cov_2.288048_1_plen_294_part_00